MYLLYINIELWIPHINLSITWMPPTLLSRPSHGPPTFLPGSCHDPPIVIPRSSHGSSMVLPRSQRLTMWPWCRVCALCWYAWVGRCAMHSLQHVHVRSQCQHVQNMAHKPTCEDVYVDARCRYIRYTSDVRQMYVRCTPETRQIHARDTPETRQGSSRPSDISSLHVQFVRGTLCIRLSYTL